MEKIKAVDWGETVTNVSPKEHSMFENITDRYGNPVPLALRLSGYIVNQELLNQIKSEQSRSSIPPYLAQPDSVEDFYL